MELIHRRKLYHEVLDRLIGAISTAEYPPGSQLPSERDLMATFNVGRPAIREAMQALQQMGLVRISHGERARVVNPTPDALIDQISSAMIMMLAVNPRGLDDLKQARILLETGLVRTATIKATPADLHNLSQVMASMTAATGDSARFVAADIAFHIAIAEISGNQLIASVLRGMLVWLSRFKRDLISVRGAEALTIDEHARIYEAMAAGKPKEAVEAMRGHLTRANELYSKLAALPLNEPNAR